MCVCVCVRASPGIPRIIQCLIHRFAALVIPKWQHPLSARSPGEKGGENEEKGERERERKVRRQEKETNKGGGGRMYRCGEKEVMKEGERERERGGRRDNH